MNKHPDADEHTEPGAKPAKAVGAAFLPSISRVHATHLLLPVAFILRHRIIILPLIIVQAVCYSFFFTTVFLTNHTFPNVLVQNYPSHKTLGEGRWLADILILFQGGSGVQPFQMVLAVLLQAVNACLVAELIGLRSKWKILLAGTTLCLFPAFADYYSFAIDHFAFVLGDTFALIGTLIFVKGTSAKTRVAGSSLFYLFTLACYQPKASLIGLLAIIGVLLSCLTSKDRSYISATRCIALMLVSIAMALFLYWFSIHLTITQDIGERTHVNSLAESMKEVIPTYLRFWPMLGSKLGGLPPGLSVLPLFGVGSGACLILARLFLRNYRNGFVALVLVMLIPLALGISYVINNNTWHNAGRITTAFAYCFVFFCAYGLTNSATKWICGPVLLVSAFFFGILATQTANAAAFKSIYDINFINRIAARVDEFTDRATQQRIPIVVAGHYPAFQNANFIRFPTDGHKAHLFSDAFAPYRQVSMLNFFLGVDVLREPTAAELSQAVAGMVGKPTWPSTGSVYMENGIMAVVLEHPKPGVPLTWTAR